MAASTSGTSSMLLMLISLLSAVFVLVPAAHGRVLKFGNNEEHSFLRRLRDNDSGALATIGNLANQVVGGPPTNPNPPASPGPPSPDPPATPGPPSPDSPATPGPPTPDPPAAPAPPTAATPPAATAPAAVPPTVEAPAPAKPPPPPIIRPSSENPTPRPPPPPPLSGGVVKDPPAEKPKESPIANEEKGSATAPAAANTEDEGSSNTNSRTIGIAIGSVIGAVALLAICGSYCYRNRKQDGPGTAEIDHQFNELAATTTRVGGNNRGESFRGSHTSGGISRFIPFGGPGQPRR